MDPRTAAMLTAALASANRGWPVFPLRPGTKRPALHGVKACPGTGACRDGHRGWEQRATTDRDRITTTWSHAAYNVGLATGPAGLVVIDLDLPDDDTSDGDGMAVLASLCRTRGATLPDTYTVTTPSGGQHLYFTAPPGVALRNTSRALGPHIDTRAGGGYVVAAGSTLPNGAYELTDDTDPAELPGWLVQALCQNRPHAISERDERPVARRDSYTTAALRSECDRVRNAPRGQHNAVLSNAAYNLGQLIGADLLTEPDATRELTDAAQSMLTADCSCTPREIARVIRAGLTAGTRRPRRKDAA